MTSTDVTQDGSRLIRGMGPAALTAFAINATIGSGILGLPGNLAALAGPYSVLVIVACGLMMALVALCFAEVSSRFDRTGGPQLYTSVGFGPAVGFATGWLCWLSRVASCAAIVNLLIGYGGILYPALQHPAVRAVVISTLTFACAWLNIRGIRPTAAVNSAFAVCKVLPLLALAAWGMSAVAPQALALGALPPAADLSKAALLAMFAYSGFEAPTVLAGEGRDARRSVPFALLLSLVVVTLLYALIQCVCIGLLPALALSERPLVDAATTLAGPRALPGVGFAAVITSVGVFGATMTSATRLLFAMAEQEQLPTRLAYIHPRFRTPVGAILVTAGVVLILGLSGSFIYLVKLSLVGRVSVYAATCAVLPLFRRRKDIPEASFRVPAGSTVAYGCIVALALCLSRSSIPELLDVVVALTVGLGIFGLTRFARRSPVPGNS
jgi:basic amino acid/polyamine antiporter, APA family